MNIIVSIKQVPDTETKIRFADGATWIDETGVSFVMSPYDEYAVEEAIRIREAKGGEITIVTAGPERAAQALRAALAMGADKAIHVKDDAIDRADSLTTARVLAAVVGALPFDMVIVGKYGVGTDNGQVGPMLAHLLDIPHVSAVSRLEIGDGRITAQREIEGAIETVESSLPVLISAEKGLNEPRYPSLKGIMAAKKKPVETRDLASTGVALPAAGAEPARQAGLEAPPPRKEGRIFTSEAAEAAREVARLLREEAKVI